MKKMLLLLMFPLTANALMCYTIDTSGKKYYDFVGKPTINLSGKTATIKPCKIEPPIIASEVCTNQAKLACHPSWGSLPIGSKTPDVDYCGYYHLFKGGVDEDGSIRYEIGQVFDGRQVIENRWLCPKNK
jgi:hypothetical protein